MYFLHLYAESTEVPDGDHAIALYRSDGADRTLLASHDVGVSLADIEGVPITQLLKPPDPDINHKAFIRKAGMALYQRLAPPAIDKALRAIERGAVTLVPHSPELSRIPWELTRRLGSPRPLFADLNAPWLCGTEDTQVSTTAVRSEWPLRMLVVVGSKPGDERVQALQESYALEELARGQTDTGAGRPTSLSGLTGGHAAAVEARPDTRPPARTRSDILLSFLFQPTLDQLARSLQSFKPHVFHFIGHGRIQDGEPELRVYSEQDRSNHSWGYDQITTAFDLQAVPGLVYLDACHSGAEALDSWSLTQAFRDIGVGAIISIQREILGSTAVECARRFYTNLFAGQSAAQAMAEVRGSLIAKAYHDEWYLPRLWIRGAPEASIQLLSSPSASARDDLFRCPSLSERLCFVGRWPQRYEAWRESAAATESGLMVIHGEPDSGRTAFVQLLMETRALAGYTIHYVDFRGIGGDYLTILDRILAMRTTDGHCSFIRAPLVEAGFQRFTELRPTDDQRRDNALVGNLRKRLMTAFWHGLSASAADAPLLLVLDHMESSQIHDDVVCKQIAYEFLHAYRPVGTRSSIQAIVILDNQQAQMVGKQPFHDDPPFIELREFSPKERDHYMPLYFDWRRLPDPQAAERMRDFIVEFKIPCPAGFERAESLLAMVRRNRA